MFNTLFCRDSLWHTFGEVSEHLKTILHVFAEKRKIIRKSHRLCIETIRSTFYTGETTDKGFFYSLEYSTMFFNQITYDTSLLFNDYVN